MPCIGPWYGSCNPGEGFHPIRSRSCKPEKPDHISEPGPARPPQPSRLSKSPQPESASEPPSGTDGTASAQGSRQPTLIQVNSRSLASLAPANRSRSKHGKGGSAIDPAPRLCGLAVDAQILRDSVLAGAMHGIVAVTCVRATATIPASHRVRCPPGGDGASEFEMRRRLAAASSSRLRRLGDVDEDCRQRRKGNGDRACSGHPGCLAQTNRPPPIHRAGGRWSG